MADGVVCSSRGRTARDPGHVTGMEYGTAGLNTVVLSFLFLLPLTSLTHLSHLSQLPDGDEVDLFLT